MDGGGRGRGGGCWTGRLGGGATGLGAGLGGLILGAAGWGAGFLGGVPAPIVKQVNDFLSQSPH